MSTYEDDRLVVRFRALAPTPLAGDWEDVRARASTAPRAGGRLADWLESRRRRPLVVLLAAVVLVVVLGAASAFAVRAILAAHGIVGLAPTGATPSNPEHGELVLFFGFGHSMGDQGRFDLNLYADGRVIWQRLGDISRTDEYRDSTGLLEQRLTSEGVELVRAEVIASGLVKRDLDLEGGDGDLYFGSIDLRSGDKRVQVTWGDGCCPLPVEPLKSATPEQKSALVRLDKRLENLVNWLPASAWDDPVERPYVPARYSVCLAGKRGLGLTRVLALLPPKAEELLRAQENTPEHGTNLVGTFVHWCSHMTNEEAHALERVLDDAGVPGNKDEFGLAYGLLDIAYAEATDFSLGFNPLLPDRG